MIYQLLGYQWEINLYPFSKIARFLLTCTVQPLNHLNEIYSGKKMQLAPTVLCLKIIYRF